MALSLSYEEINSISSQLRSKATSMETLLNNVKTELNKVGDGGVWSGSAASAARQEFNSLASKFSDFKKSVDNCASYLATTAEHYQHLDKMVQGIDVQGVNN